MPKRTSIRWKTGEKERLRKEIRNYNARRRRAIKKNPMLAGTVPTLPPEHTIKGITTRKQLQDLLAEIKLSKKKDAFTQVKVGDIKVTKWELDVQKRRLRQINQARAAARKKAGIKPGGGTMGTIAQNALNPKKMAKPKSRKEWDKFVEATESNLKKTRGGDYDRIYRENYYSAFLETYGLAEATELMFLLEQLTHEQIAAALFKYPLLNIEYLYDERELEQESHLEEVIETWKKYIQELGL